MGERVTISDYDGNKTAYQKKKKKRTDHVTKFSSFP